MGEKTRRDLHKLSSLYDYCNCNFFPRFAFQAHSCESRRRAVREYIIQNAIIFFINDLKPPFFFVNKLFYSVADHRRLVKLNKLNIFSCC